MTQKTQQEIARLAVCSVATVSRVLNNRSRISERTRRRVMACAKAIGYSGSRQCRAIAVILYKPALRDIYSPVLQSACAMELQRRGFKPLIVYYNDLELLTERYIGGAIALTPYEAIARKWPVTYNQPLICINDHSCTFAGVSSVLSDEDSAARTVFSFLATEGYCRVVLLTLAETTLSTGKRIEAARKYAAYFKVDLELISCDGRLTGQNRHCLPPLSPKCEAVICSGELFQLLPEVTPQFFYDGLLKVVWGSPALPIADAPDVVSLSQDYLRLGVAAVDMLAGKLAGIEVGPDRLVPYLFSGFNIRKK